MPKFYNYLKNHGFMPAAQKGKQTGPGNTFVRGVNVKTVSGMPGDYNAGCMLSVYAHAAVICR